MSMSRHQTAGRSHNITEVDKYRVGHENVTVFREKRCEIRHILASRSVYDYSFRGD
jgi:hypothetical protein